MSRANHQDRSEELPKEIPVSAQIHALIENIKKAIQNRDKQQLKENLAQLSEFFRINTAKESLEAHNRRIYNILRLMAENYHAPWEVFMEVSEIVRDKKGNVIETTDTQRRPTIESILAMEHSH